MQRWHSQKVRGLFGLEQEAFSVEVVDKALEEKKAKQPQQRQPKDE